MSTEKLSNVKIGKIKYNGVSFNLLLSNLDKFNDMAANITTQSILITTNYFRMTENEKEVFMWHELGHIINSSTDEFVADKFAAERTSKERFEDAINEAFIRSVSYLHYNKEKALFRSYSIYRINAIMNIEIKTINEKFEIDLYDKFKGDKGIEELIILSKTLTEKDAGRMKGVIRNE